MYNELQGQTAIVTGVGSANGMGYAIASRLSEEGCNVVIADIRPIDEIESLAKMIARQGGKTLAAQCDVSSPDSIENMVAESVAEFGQIDILINNAGILKAKAFLDYDASEWDLMYQVIVKGSYLCTKAVASHMISRRIAGTIINISSMGGKRVFEGEAAYGACKRAVVHLTQAAAVELSPKNIRVNGVAPGDHWTDMLEQCFREMAKNRACTVDDLIAETTAETPLGRLGTTEDIANICAFLASGQASFITGQVINVNGGLHME